MSTSYFGLYLILFYYQISLYSSHTLNNNTNASIGTTLFPLTTTEFESTLHYYPASTLIPSNASRITVTLDFYLDSIPITNDLLNELTAILEALLIKAAKNNGYKEYDDILSVYPLSMNATNATLNNTYLQFAIIVLIPEDEHLVSLLAAYLSSAKFIKQYNDNLSENIQLINIQTLEVYPPTNSTSTTTTNSAATENIDTTQYEDDDDKFILPQHMRQYMLIYAVLFCVLSISLCCCCGWFCTMKYIANEVHTNEKVVEDEDDKILNGEIKEHNVYIKTNADQQNGTNKWDEIDKTEAEFMMKAFDDDEALQQNWFKDDSDNANSDEIQMINVTTRESYNESLDFHEKLKIISAFDED